MIARLVLAAAVLVAGAAVLLGAHRELPDWYVRAVPAWYARAVYPLEHELAIRGAARRNGVDPALIAAVIYAESGFREGAVSESGAVGLMQLLPSTATEIARRTGGDRFELSDLRDPAVNIRYGSHYLGILLERYDGSLVEAVAAYHAGVHNVDRWAARGGGRIAVKDIPFADTREYVDDVVALVTVYERTYGRELGRAA